VPFILLVDDEADLVDVLADALTAGIPGARVVRAAGSADAVTVLDRLLQEGDAPDLLLTDQGLGDGLGLDLIEALRERLPQLRAVLYTGQAGPEVVAAASRLRARVLWKPIRLATLLAEVRGALAA
jgi:DNA-binding NtrC family response regulator